MIAKIWFITGALFFTLSDASAKEQPGDCPQHGPVEDHATVVMAVGNSLNTEGCADASKLSGICVAVYKEWNGPKNSDYDYMYEKIIHDASCATLNDSEEVIREKVKNMWSKLEDPYLKCDQANFDVPRGSILKYSVALHNYDFLSLAVEEWKVNLNAIDKNDDSTLLDYVKKELIRYKGSQFEQPLKDYYRKLKKYGAKHRSEL